VTKSCMNTQRLLPFAAARALRIYPALVVATAFSLVLASWSNPLPFDAFMALPQSFDYFWRNATGFEARDQLVGAYLGNPYPGAVNGSLWTLPIELRLYLGLAIAGGVSLLARRWAWTFVIAVLCALFAANPDWFVLSPHGRAAERLALLFALGSLAYLWRDTIPLSLVALSGAIALIVLNPAGLTRGVLFAPLLCYTLLTIAYHPALRWSAFNRLGDYSYGLYVYSFPIQQTVVRMMPEADPALVFACTMLLTLPLAALSWHLLEKPALGLKSRFR